MQYDANEYHALKGTLAESKKLAEEFKISLTELLLLRQLIGLRWLCLSGANTARNLEQVPPVDAR